MLRGVSVTLYVGILYLRFPQYSLARKNIKLWSFFSPITWKKGQSIWRLSNFAVINLFIILYTPIQWWCNFSGVFEAIKKYLLKIKLINYFQCLTCIFHLWQCLIGSKNVNTIAFARIKMHSKTFHALSSFLQLRNYEREHSSTSKKHLPLWNSALWVQYTREKETILVHLKQKAVKRTLKSY